MVDFEPSSSSAGPAVASTGRTFCHIDHDATLSVGPLRPEGRDLPTGGDGSCLSRSSNTRVVTDDIDFTQVSDK